MLNYETWFYNQNMLTIDVVPNATSNGINGNSGNSGNRNLIKRK